jgi:hypothetical protein
MTLTATSTTVHRARRTRLVALIAAAAAMSSMLAVAPSLPVSAATYTIVNTGGVGVRQRFEPRVASPYNGVAPEGSSITTICQTWGEPVGAYSNRLWLKVTRPGYASAFFIADTYTNSPRKAADPALPGIPMCGTTTPPPPPTPPAGPYLNSAAGYRYCTNIGLPGCAVRGTIPASSAATMHCWIDDSWVTERYGSARWFYVTAGGIRGFVHSSRVERQSSVPHCSTHTGISVSRWAAAQQGQTAAPALARTIDSRTNNWSGWCYVFVATAYKATVAWTPKLGTGSAKNAAIWYRNQGRLNTDLTHSRISIGSIVFWTSGTFGHAAIYLGQGQVATTRGTGAEPTPLPIAVTAMSTFGTPAGWVSPANARP